MYPIFLADGHKYYKDHYYKNNLQKPCIINGEINLSIIENLAMTKYKKNKINVCDEAKISIEDYNDQVNKYNEKLEALITNNLKN